MTSALPIHPWFRNPSLKRKGSYTVDSPDIATFETSPRTKRRRCDNLEHGFAQMTLNPAAIVPPVQQQPLFMQTSPFGSNPPPFQPLGGTVNLNGTSIPPAADTTVQPTDVPSPVPVDIDPPSPRSKTSVPSWYEPQKDRKSLLRFFI
ncbi:hypothetical protein K474DRAFT_1655731 [Panus rudis PR-1116 ss-1]|nr:hypothetical protein K474DRAFT_1655731 [Panus rudis PR-1116 ss-1]